MTLETRLFDVAEYLNSPEDIAAYLEMAFEDQDPAEIAAAIGTAARAYGMAEIARRTGLSRTSLYRALSPAGRPELPTLVAVLEALGVRLTTVADASKTSAAA